MATLMAPSNFLDPKNTQNAPLLFTVNFGSSSLKCTLFAVDENKKQFYHLIEVHAKQKSDEVTLVIESTFGKKEKSVTAFDFASVLPIIFDEIQKQLSLTFKNLKAICHRFVHGGSHEKPLFIEKREDLAILDPLMELAPLHNPICLAGIKETLKYFKNSLQIIVFDTSLYHALPDRARLYAIDNALAQKHDIRRYGFHGLAHGALLDTYARNLGKKEDKIITVHLGNGCSITAFKEGSPIDTTMGFTPLEGLVMATRSGDIDPTVVEFLMKKENKNTHEILDMLNHKSGLLGLSGISSHMEELLLEVHTNQKAQLAIDLFNYRAIKYLGAYMAALGGVDAIIFSGGIGENSPQIRKEILSPFQWIGVALDFEINDRAISLFSGEIRKISRSQSQIPLYTIGVDENLQMAKMAHQSLMIETKETIC